MNSVVTTRNLLDGCRRSPRLRRFVNVSSFAVYSNTNKPRRRLLGESCPVQDHPEQRADAYCYAKVKQDEKNVGPLGQKGLYLNLFRGLKGGLQTS
jgi:nucleoside-diphosphate-sugar epimerase